MFSTEISFGHSASQAVMLEHMPKPSSSIWCTIFCARFFASTWPCGNRARCETLALTNSIAEAFGQAATQAPQPIFADGDGVAIGRLASVHGNVTSSLDDAVKGRAVHHEVFQHGKRLGPEWFDDDGLAVLEMAHVELASGRAVHRAVRLAIDDEAARTADTFPAVVLESYRFFLAGNKALVQYIEHFEEGHVLIGHDLVVLEFAFIFCVFLSPDF
jgi:hypothetical protein